MIKMNLRYSDKSLYYLSIIIMLVGSIGGLSGAYSKNDVIAGIGCCLSLLGIFLSMFYTKPKDKNIKQENSQINQEEKKETKTREKKKPELW